MIGWTSHALLSFSKGIHIMCITEKCHMPSLKKLVLYLTGCFVSFESGNCS